MRAGSGPRSRTGPRAGRREATPPRKSAVARPPGAAPPRSTSRARVLAASHRRGGRGGSGHATTASPGGDASTRAGQCKFCPAHGAPEGRPSHIGPSGAPARARRVRARPRDRRAAHGPGDLLPLRVGHLDGALHLGRPDHRRDVGRTHVAGEPLAERGKLRVRPGAEDVGPDDAYLRDLGMTLQRPRPRHVKADPEAQAAFRKTPADPTPCSSRVSRRASRALRAGRSAPRADPHRAPRVGAPRRATAGAGAAQVPVALPLRLRPPPAAARCSGSSCPRWTRGSSRWP